MVFNHTYRIGLEDCGRENEATNKAILTILEDIAGLHSATVGLGLNEINKTGYAWVILKWQVQIIKRPRYNDELNVYTWSTSVDKLFADRDFKVIDNNGETAIIATSRWIYMDINSLRQSYIFLYHLYLLIILVVFFLKQNELLLQFALLVLLMLLTFHLNVL